MRRLVSAVALLAALLPLQVYSQPPGEFTGTGDQGLGGNAYVRLQQLESETAALKAELAALKQHTQGSEGSSATSDTPASLTAMSSPSPAPAGGGEYFTLDELKAEMNKLTWRKGAFSITPYGILWGTASYETQRTNNGDYVLWTYSPTQSAYTPTVNGGDAFHVDGKSTRLGLDIVGPRVPLLNCAQSGGKVEVDFQRQIDTENRASLLLRHAYVEVKNEEFRLLVGQTWDVISPLNPGILMYTVGWDGGNIGYRRPQFRAERYVAISDELLITAQGSIDSDIVSDSAGGVTVDHAGWPILEGRLGATVGPRGQGCLPWDFGVSSHVGQTAYTFVSTATTPWPNPVNNLERQTWSFNVDMKIPLTHCFGVQGEFFTGENLGTYYGGVGQGIDIGTPGTPGTRRPIRSTGGWFDVWLDITPRLHSHVGYSIDDPFNEDVTVGRTYNAFVFGNVSYNLTDGFLVGVEVTSWKTLWAHAAPGDSVNTALVVKYNF